LAPGVLVRPDLPGLGVGPGAVVGSTVPQERLSMTNLTGGKGPTELARRRSRRSIRCEVRFSEVFAGISFVTLVKEGKMAGGGLATSIVVFAAGAVLRFALTVNTYQHDEHGNGTASDGHRRRPGQPCPPRRHLHLRRTDGTAASSFDSSDFLRDRVHRSLLVDRGRRTACSVARRNGDRTWRIGGETSILPMVTIRQTGLQVSEMRAPFGAPLSFRRLSPVGVAPG
jgi:hypothetical protein